MADNYFGTNALHHIDAPLFSPLEMAVDAGAERRRLETELEKELNELSMHFEVDAAALVSVPDFHDNSFSFSRAAAGESEQQTQHSRQPAPFSFDYSMQFSTDSTSQTKIVNVDNQLEDFSIDALARNDDREQQHFDFQQTTYAPPLSDENRTEINCYDNRPAPVAPLGIADLEVDDEALTKRFDALLDAELRKNVHGILKVACKLCRC